MTLEQFEEWVKGQGHTMNSVIDFETWELVRSIQDSSDGELFQNLKEGGFGPLNVEDLRDYIEQKDDEGIKEYQAALKDFWANTNLYKD